METTLHRQLKEFYCRDGCQTEVKLDDYRIDVVDGKRLIEIQHSALSSISGKIKKLTVKHKVDVVKPIIVRKRLIKLDKKNGSIVSKRLSPKRGCFLDLVHELLYFTKVFPHKNLRIITPFIEVEETRYPGHGKRRRKRAADFVVADRTITEILDSRTYKTIADLNSEIPKIKQPFDTADLAKAMQIKRWQAQQIAYVYKHTGAFKAVGKNGNAITYKLIGRRRAKAA